MKKTLAYKWNDVKIFQKFHFFFFFNKSERFFHVAVNISHELPCNRDLIDALHKFAALLTLH